VAGQRGGGRDAKAAWIAAMRAAARPVPPPGADPSEDYSGKWQLRTPKSLHRDLADRARREGISLNTLAVTLLAQGLGLGLGLGGPGRVALPRQRGPHW
jgi:antitoxin HicB